MKMCISFQFHILRGTLIIFMCKSHLYATQQNSSICLFYKEKETMKK